MDYTTGYMQATTAADEIRAKASAMKTSGLASKKLKNLGADFEGIDPVSLGLFFVEDIFSDLDKESTKVKDYLDSLEETPTESNTIRPMARANTPVATDIPEREILAKTLQAEAGLEGFDGMLAVGAVIDNRVKNKGFGDTFRDVILSPGQFSAWNSATGYAKGEQGQNMDLIKPSKNAYKAADAILSGEYESPVGNALNYFNPKVSTPKWFKGDESTWQRIGNHLFGFAE